VAAILAALSLAACSVGSSPPDVSATQVAPTGSKDPWGQVDAALSASPTGNLAYTAPSEMTLDEVRSITLLMSPSASTAELEQALAGVDDIVVSARICDEKADYAHWRITPRARPSLRPGCGPPGAAC